MVCKNCIKIILDFQYLIKTFYETEEYLKSSVSQKETKSTDSEEQKQYINDSNQVLFYNNDGKMISK